MHVKISVKAGSRRERISAQADGSYIISVREPAERGMANRRALELIASAKGLSGKKVRMVSGHRKPQKIIHISN